MTKNLVIAGHRKKVIQVFADQLKSLFGKDISIKLIVKGMPIPEMFDKDSLVMIQSYDIFKEIQPYIRNVDNIIFMSIALQTNGLKKIENLPKDDLVIVAGDSMEIARGLLKCLIQSGGTHLNMRPADLFHKEAFQDKVVIVSGIPEEEIPNAGEIIDLCEPLLDVETILDVGLKLDKNDILFNTNIRSDFLEFQAIHEGIIWNLERANSLNSSVRILLDVIDGTVISIEQTGRVRACNERVESLFGVKQEKVIGKNGIELFPLIPFEEILQGKSSMLESIITINGEEMVITVKSIFNSGKRYGAIAVIKRFADEEIRQNNLRALRMGKGYLAKYRFEDIVGESEVMLQCKDMALRMSASNSSVLIIGETGTGKEMFAQAIHNASERNLHQFVAVNCGAIPESLLESELFGYEEGAFTGARKGGNPGFFELAHKGTLFLDEISEMDKPLQKRLLRVLQEREITRLGGNSVIHVDVRIIAATNRDLGTLSRAGDFRQDLYYRLNVLPLRIPPLRKRTGDVRILATLFQKQLNSTYEFTEPAWQELERYTWPGNVRELCNYIEYFSNLFHSVIGINEISQIVPISAPIINERIPDKEITNDFRSKDQNIFVLRMLKEEGLEKRRRLGRRSISLLAKKHGIFLSEQEARRILKTLEKQGLVVINQTKAGTIITSKGEAVLNEFL